MSTLFSLTNLFSQGLSVKWESLYESEDKSIVEYVSGRYIQMDKAENTCVYIANHAFVPAFLFYDINGGFLQNVNLYSDFVNQDSTFKMVYSNEQKQMYLEFNQNSNYFESGMIVTVTNNHQQSFYLREYFIKGSLQDNFITSTPLNTTLNDAVKSPKGLFNYNDSTFLSVQSSQFPDYIFLAEKNGRIKKKLFNGADSLFKIQYVIDSKLDNENNLIYLLSGIRNFNHPQFPNRDKFFGFQIRSYSINRVEDSLILNSTTTFRPPEKSGKLDEYYVTDFLSTKDYFYILGYRFSYDTLTLPPFVMKLTKDGKMESIKLFSDSLKPKTFILSNDKSKIIIVGSEVDTNQLVSQVIYELDTNLYIENKLLLNTNVSGNKSLYSVYSCLNGDYIVSGAIGYVNEYNNSNPQKGWATTARITHTTTSTIDIQPHKTSVKVTPNPSTEMATVEFESSPEASTIQLVDVKGNVLRTLYQKTTQNTHQSSVTFRVSDLANGMYYVVVGNGTKTLETVPLSIQR